MLTKFKDLFRKPTPLEKAVAELAQLDYYRLKITAEISWAQHRLAYTDERSGYLKEYVQSKTCVNDPSTSPKL